MENNFGMKWHKFLVYFSLWANGIFSAILGVACMSIVAEPFGRYRHSHSDMVPVLALLGILFFVFAVLSIVVRFKLARFKAGAPKFLLVVQIASSVISGAFMAIDVDASILNIFTGMIIPIITYYYYNKRAELFVN